MAHGVTFQIPLMSISPRSPCKTEVGLHSLRLIVVFRPMTWFTLSFIIIISDVDAVI